MYGICQGGQSSSSVASEDIDMEGEVNGGINVGKRRIIVGSADLTYKRDAMEI